MRARAEPTAIARAWLAGSIAIAVAHAQTTERVSVDSSGAQADSWSASPSISADGRYVAFESSATNLVGGDGNGAIDVFLRDRQIGLTIRVSLGAGGARSDGNSELASISGDGRFVAFQSYATNLVAADTNGDQDVFVHDVATGVTTRVSVDSAGAQADARSATAAITADGRFVVFASNATNLVAGDTNAASDVFLHERATGQTTRVSLGSGALQGDGRSFDPSISGDARYVAFVGESTNFVPGDDAGPDVFVHDRATGTTALASVDSSGVKADGESRYPSISADGRYVAFESVASNLIAGDVNGKRDVFVRDLPGGRTTIASIGTTGALGDGYSIGASLSGDGRFVLFHSSSSNLVHHDVNASGDLFTRDLTNGQTTLVSIDSAGLQGNGDSGPFFASAISPAGRFVAYHSLATNLGTGDTNGELDVFVSDRQCAGASTYCTAKINSLGCSPTIGWSGAASASAGLGFSISASQTINNKTGLFFYSHAGQQAVPFQGGLLCVKPPTKRTPLQSSGGNPPPNDCSGSYSIDFNAYVATGADAALVAGAAIDGQYWARDPGFAPPNNVSLSDAIHVAICP